MPFVEQRGREHECHGPEFCERGIKFLVVERPERQHRQDEVFRNVPAFPDEEMPEIDLNVGECGEKESQSRSKKQRVHAW